MLTEQFALQHPYLTTLIVIAFIWFLKSMVDRF